MSAVLADLPAVNGERAQVGRGRVVFLCVGFVFA